MHQQSVCLRDCTGVKFYLFPIVYGGLRDLWVQITVQVRSAHLYSRLNSLPNLAIRSKEKDRKQFAIQENEDEKCPGNQVEEEVPGERVVGI